MSWINTMLGWKSDVMPLPPTKTVDLTEAGDQGTPVQGEPFIWPCYDHNATPALYPPIVIDGVPCAPVPGMPDFILDDFPPNGVDGPQEEYEQDPPSTSDVEVQLEEDGHDPFGEEKFLVYTLSVPRFQERVYDKYEELLEELTAILRVPRLGESIRVRYELLTRSEFDAIPREDFLHPEE